MSPFKLILFGLLTFVFFICIFLYGQLIFFR
ncbi:MAG: hypothetical protein MRECE_25c002 [Mycoplasmataceae bacterium CE_OT135]|nr:MAG: hypothetical protein MRECE_25c002 [Mycoplasmataceae bacterium CE_OT135]